jgi:Xaa-Pro aminopeptidase
MRRAIARENIEEISVQEYQARRAKLMQQLPGDSIAILPAAAHAKRTHSSEYPYRQDSNFYYLTGLNEPNAVLLLLPATKEVILFNQAPSEKKLRWEGPVLGQADAPKKLGVDQSHAIAEADKMLPNMAKGRTVYSTHAHLPWLETQKIKPLGPIIAEQRVIKSPAEIELMRKAAQISVAAHQRGMQQVKHCEYEYQLAAEYEYVFKHQGGNSLAYESIVGGGANACVLHYQANKDQLRPGELVLVDAAAEYQNYAADITRSYPVSGKFSAQQKDIYEVVLQAQEDAIAQLRPGNTWPSIQAQIVEQLVDGLLELGLIKGDKKDYIANKKYQDFYMHSAGHWLGLDVHDVGAYTQDEKPRAFEAGMALTIEPGIYLSEMGLGIRIEDDIVVTENGCDVLSKGLAKSIADVEFEMAK